MAWMLKGRLPESVDLEDLAAAGACGLVGAARRFDPSRGTPFEIFARKYIRGTMLDLVRGARFREYKHAALDDHVATLPDPQDSAELRLISAREWSRVRAAIRRLNPQRRAMIELRYLDDVDMPEAAARLGLSNRVAANVRMRAIGDLRRLLRSPSARRK